MFWLRMYGDWLLIGLITQTPSYCTMLIYSTCTLSQQKKPTTCNRMCDDLFGSLRSSISFKTVIHQQLNHSSKIRGNSTPVHLISVIPPPPRTSVHLLSTWPNEGCLKASEIQYLTTWLYPGQTSKVIKRRGKVGGAKADRWTR